MSSEIDLPHTTDGKVDWDTLGKILCAHLMGEVLCASYVDMHYGVADPNIVPDTDWKFLYHENDVVALQKTYKDSPINAFMGRGIINLPMETIVEYLETHEHRKEWDRYLVEIKPVRILSYIDSIIYMRCVATNCLVKQERDFLHFERMTHVGGKYVRSAMAVDLPEYPPNPGIIRAELKAGSGWVLEPYRGCTTQTLVSYLAHIDLKAVPPLIVNRIMRRQPKAIQRIRKILMSNPGKTLTLDHLGEREVSPASMDSLSSLEHRQVLQATEEYHQSMRQYSDDVAIDEFLGVAPDCRQHKQTVSVNFNPHSDKGNVETGVRVKGLASENVPSPTTTAAATTTTTTKKKTGIFKSSFKRGRSSLKEKKSSSKNATETAGKGKGYHRMSSTPSLGVASCNGQVKPGGAVAMHSLHGGASVVASNGTGVFRQASPNLSSQSVSTATTTSGELVEMIIDSDPHIAESTGLAVDSPELFYTPHESEDDCSDSNDKTHLPDLSQGPPQDGEEPVESRASHEHCTGKGYTSSVKENGSNGYSVRYSGAAHGSRGHHSESRNDADENSTTAQERPDLSPAGQNGQERTLQCNQVAEGLGNGIHRAGGKESEENLSNALAQKLSMVVTDTDIISESRREEGSRPRTANGVGDDTRCRSSDGSDEEEELSLSMPLLRSCSGVAPPISLEARRVSSEKIISPQLVDS